MSINSKSKPVTSFEKKLEDKMSGKKSKQEEQMFKEDMRHRQRKEEIIKINNPGITIN
jgi:hypothetical protein